jgi:hypothetical protein
MLRGSVFACFLLAVGCKGSMNADAQMSADLDGHAGAEINEIDRPVSQEQMAASRQAAFGDDAAAAPVPVLFGARHDFTVKDSSGAIACRCVSVLLGLPTSGKLAWRGEPPRVRPESQLVVGLIPDAGDCPGTPKGSGGASYWGYRVVGNDVVVFLENWKPSLPRTLGAIIPKPPSGGQVYLAPVSNKFPYGAATTGTSERCAAGNPGAQRTEPFSAADQGAENDSEPASSLPESSND